VFPKKLIRDGIIGWLVKGDQHKALQATPLIWASKSKSSTVFLLTAGLNACKLPVHSAFNWDPIERFYHAQDSICHNAWILSFLQRGHG
jgi:hypothetical protein